MDLRADRAGDGRKGLHRGHRQEEEDRAGERPRRPDGVHGHGPPAQPHNGRRTAHPQGTAGLALGRRRMSLRTGTVSGRRAERARTDATSHAGEHADSHPDAHLEQGLRRAVEQLRTDRLQPLRPQGGADPTSGQQPAGDRQRDLDRGRQAGGEGEQPL